MTDQTQPLSQIEAVNMMLEAVFEAPVNTLDAAGIEDVAIAKRLLGSKVREILARGVANNIEHGVMLQPDSLTQQIPLPLNTMRVDTEPDDGLDVVQRGSFLYDRGNHTFLFTRAVKVCIYYSLEWDDLPEHVKYAVAVMAARRFQKHVLGDEAKGGYDQTDEMIARETLAEGDTDMEDANVLTDSWSVYALLDR